MLDSDYPSAEHKYGDVFVHTRVKEYQEHSFVKVVSFFRDWQDYEYDGVQVFHAPRIEDVIRLFKEFNPDRVFIHFYNRKLFNFIKSINVPVIIWVHGYEALGWYRRLFNYTPYQLLRHLHHIIPPNIRQMKGFRKMVKYSNRNNRVKLVFVSDWMRKIAQTDSFLRIKNYVIIPNPIDIDLFEYKPKNIEDRKRILMIRSFASKKYANDVAIEAILLLSTMPFFKELSFSIYGRGKYFKSLTEPLCDFQNVELHETFLDNSDIPGIHKRYGVFLCPTRQDAQGVSMCEAMSSGLVPVTSYSTAIPEFVDHMQSGILTNDAKELALAIEQLYKNPGLFLSLSVNASKSILGKCEIANVVKRELAVNMNS